MKKLPFIIIAGPTAVGKSKFAIALANEINGEIISADSMQVYHHMDIGSAKILPSEMGNIPHHLINVLDPKEKFDVVRFQSMAKDALHQIYQRGRIPIIAGGTGFYIQALLYDIDFTENKDDKSYREYLTSLLDEHKEDTLYELLKQVDPESCETIHKNNWKRVIRALEFYHLTGKKISSHNEVERQKESPYNAIYFVLTDDRSNIYENIDVRVDKMIQDGLVDEVKGLLELGCNRTDISMQGLGYKEIIAFLEHEISLEEAIYQIKRDTRHFAKRQLTWFRREKNVIWIDKQAFSNDEKQILEYMKDKIRQANIC